jgi:FkbM family methyltransferase
LRSRLLGILARVGGLLRALGLGRFVTRIRRLLEPLLGRSSEEVDGLRIMGATIGHRGQIQAWRVGKKEAFMTSLFKQATEPGMTVVDVGAYIGYFSLLAGKRVGPKGNVWAFEPNPRSFAMLKENIAENDLGNQVVALQMALSNSVEPRTFFFDSTDESRSGLTAPDDCVGETVVECTTADAHFGTGMRVDVIKIDVEGDEIGVLEGMSGMIRNAPEGLKLFAECNPEALQRAGGSTEELLEALRSLGLNPLVIDEAKQRLAPCEEIPPDGYVNLYCTVAPPAEKTMS